MFNTMLFQTVLMVKQQLQTQAEGSDKVKEKPNSFVGYEDETHRANHDRLYKAGQNTIKMAV